MLFTSFVYRKNVYWSVIHGTKNPHLSVVWNWYHFVAITILHQPRPTDSADIYKRLQLSDTSSIPPMHGGFLLKSTNPFQKLYAHLKGVNCFHQTLMCNSCRSTYQIYEHLQLTYH